MMDKIPKHHVKQEICATRPTYREGRIPKGVKVYTVNQESRFILIQGVPSVGATEELIKLCSSYGQVEEHHALHEYPCEDQYTEVYLIKYKRIQSARFAKRKLDDYSFFGGSLHVCYAPEYESVKETREKLQDRRRIIASKIKFHRSEVRDVNSAQNIIQPTDDNVSSEASASEIVLSDKSSPPIPTSKCLEYTHGNEIPSNETHTQPDCSNSQPSNVCDGDAPIFANNTFSFILPPPPKPTQNYRNVATTYNYEFSRVPSKHSTLPLNYDGRLQKHRDLQEKGQSVSTTPESFKSTTVSKEEINIRKDYFPKKQTLKFVPRQAVKRKSDESCHVNNATSSDDIDMKIKKNAFVLGDQQGPADLPGGKKDMPEISPGVSRSYSDTIKAIRSKISQVISDSMVHKK